MRSIRLSLVVYFLLLLAAALGAVSLLAYETASRTLDAKQQTNRQLLEAQHHERRREVIATLDNELLLHARALANIAQSQFEENRLYARQFLPFGALLAAPSPNGHSLIPLWIAEYRDERVSNLISFALASEVNLKEDMVHRTDDRWLDLAQINILSGRPWRSKSLGDSSLPFDADYFRGLKTFDWEFDDLEVNGTKLRRVRLKVPVLKSRFLPASVNIPRRGFRPSRPSTAPQVRDAAPFYIQWATDLGERNEALSDIDAETTEQLQRSDDDARRALAQLRRRLGWIAIVTFAAVCFGASVLVRLGLAPLRRLGDAVSRVSASNFQLTFVGPPPPTELVPIVERLQQTLTMLHRAFDREKQATADISHELRTPLAGLMTLVEVTLRKPRATEDYRRTLADCRDIVRQMSQMVGRLLTLSSIDASSDNLRPEAVDAGDLADQCATVIRPLAEANGLTLHVKKGVRTNVRTDAAKVREIMANLLHNAVEYNRPGGSIELNVQASESWLDLTVSDTGIGVAPELVEEIFERFFRADASRQATGIHAGLGLSIVRGYVSLLGGTISLESEVGRGSTFRVRLPAGVTH